MDFKINRDTACLIDAIVNPISHTEPCTIPDGGNLPVLPLVDYYVASQTAVTVIAPVLHPDAVGFLMYIGIGPSKTFYNVTNASTTIQPGNYYLVCIPVSAAGVAIFDSAGRASSLILQNESLIIDTPLCKGYRLIAGGVQLLPLIETVTSTATQYISKFYSGCLSQRDLNRWFSGSGVTLVSLFEAAPDFKSFSNCDGTSVRYDPLQYPKQLQWYTPVELSDVEIFNNDNLFWTCCYCEFSTAIAPVLSGANYIYTFPVRTYAKLWLEGQLVQPTPILGKLPSVDENWHQIVQSLRRMPNIFPCNVSGRSFSSFMLKMDPFYKALSQILNASSHLPIPGIRMANDINQQVIKPFIKLAKKKPISGNLKAINNGSLPKNTRIQPIQNGSKGKKKKKNKYRAIM